MGTQRYAIVMFGLSLPYPEGKYDETVEMLEEAHLDYVLDGMCGDYFLVGKQLVNYAIDAYEDNEESDPIKLQISDSDRMDVSTKLFQLFPNADTPALWHVIDYR